MRSRSALLTIGLALIGLPGAASAKAAPLPVLGAADGVQATRDGASVVLRFTGASATAAAAAIGETPEVACERHDDRGLLFGAEGSGSSSSSATVGHEADGTLTLTARDDGEDSYDICTVPRPYSEKTLGRRGPFRIVTSGPPPLARVALTPAGTVWIDELAHATQLFGAVADLVIGSAYPASLPGLAPLDGPDASSPPGEVGYWSDGAQRAVLATLSTAGRRLVSEDLGGGMLRTNLGGFQQAVAQQLAMREYDLDVSHSDPDPRRAMRGHEADVGIRTQLAGRRLTVRFTGPAVKAYRRVAGRRVSLACGPAQLPLGVGAAGADALLAGYQLATARVPRHGGAVRFTLRAGGHADVCMITDDGQPIAPVNPTPAGRVVAADERALRPLFAITELASKGATAYPSAATIAARHPKQLVALATPDAPVPAGRAGVWTDGARQIVLAVRSSTGHRLVLADEGDGMARTNTSNLFASSLVQVVLG